MLLLYIHSLHLVLVKIICRKLYDDNYHDTDDGDGDDDDDDYGDDDDDDDDDDKNKSNDNNENKIFCQWNLIIPLRHYG